jgi:hypothetical protein
MDKYHIKLTDAEAALLARIDLQASERSLGDSYKVYQANEKPVLALIESLSDRAAVPTERVKFWNDPRYNTGRTKASRKGLFERNGRTGADIYTHPHFLPYLRYFLFGADLPDAVIAAFEAKVGNPQWVTSSDIVPIGKCARDLTRQYRLDVAAAADEFFKLCLDMGLGLGTAGSVMRSVKQIR